MSAPKKAKAPVSSESNYVAVPAHIYKAGDKTDLDLYFRYQQNFLVFLKGGATWSDEETKKLKQVGVKELFVRIDDPESFNKLMEGKLDRVLADEGVSIEQKTNLVYHSMLSSVESLFSSPESGAQLKQAVSIVQGTVDLLNQSSEAFFQLFQSTSLDLSEFNHGLHTVAYAVNLAKFLGFNSPDELRQLAIGALLHDIGKSRLRKEIIEKAGPLNNDERAAVEKHSQFGFEIASRYPKLIPERSRIIILQHHERCDGSGYPKRLKREKIDPFSVIVRIADVFDSITANRPYKKRETPFNAIKEILSETRDPLELQFLIAFIEMMKRQ